MKKKILAVGLVTLSLAGCANSDSEQKTVTTPQSLQGLSSTTGTTANNVTDQTDGAETPDTNTNQATQTSNQVKTFSTQQDFVDYMHEKVEALEETTALLDSNLNQVYSVAGTDEEASYLGIRTNLLKQMTNEMTAIQELTIPTEDVTTLQDYVAKAYQYNIDYKTAEYEIYQAETLEERQTLLDTNAENERLATEYISLAWSELTRLSETTYYRK